MDARHILLVSLPWVLLLVIVIGIMRKRAGAGKKAKEEAERSYQELEEAYRQISMTQKELCARYEELKKSEEKARKQAFLDYLTGLPNRTAFTEMLENVMLTLRKEESIALMYIDLDNFKSINDSLGHSYGDELLIDVTERMKQVLNENDYLARFGGDEFILLTQNLDDIGLYEEKIRKVEKVFSYPFVLSMQEFFVTTSIGVTFAPKDGKTTQSLIKNVDFAMYEAKKTGKNTYCFYDEAINNKRMVQIEIQSELRRALEEEELLLSYQPILDLRAGKIEGFEALLRWNHPDKGILLPEQFMPLAEETGLVLSIGEFVLDKALEQLREWNGRGLSQLTMAVNLSLRQFKDKELADRAGRILQKHDIPGEQLRLEITERTAMEDLDVSLEQMELLKEMGIEFVLDDFGTGYSSMNYLKYLPVESVKLDNSLVGQLAKGTGEEIMAISIISLAHDLGRRVTAEGVEELEQEAFLKRAGCDRVQGFLYAQPLEKEALEKLLTGESL